MTTYTVFLTKGAYVVKQPDAERILDAVERSEPHVLVSADLFGDGIHFAAVRIVTAHVIAITQNESIPDERSSLRVMP